MGRPAKFDRREMAGAALKLVAAQGPRSLTVAALAKEIGAPTGSIYHRFASRDQLLAELWMDVVESFQSGFTAALGRAEDAQGSVLVARFMVDWAREHPLESRLLLLHRRQDFVTGPWPRQLAERAAALEPELGSALRAFAKRAFGRADADVMARLRFALLDAPLGGIKPYLQARKPIPKVFDEIVASTADALLGTIAVEREESGT